MRLALVLCAVALTAATSAGAADHVRATMSTSSTMPLVDVPWRYTIVVRDRAGKPIAARARLQILLGPTVVGCWKGTAMKACSGASAGTWIAFRGKRTGTLTWPAQSVGVKLTFQATVVAGGRSLKLRAPVTVRAP
ncbi:MAG TPA: hypothetical protein VFU99_00420 [Gaiellaceae bacterium]|nr:hypothetical protein [Gaiellaceae bacterium]